MKKDIAAFGLYATRGQLESGVDALRAAGFRATDVSVVVSDPTETKQLAHEINSKAPEGATAGGGAGRRPSNCAAERDHWASRARASSRIIGRL